MLDERGDDPASKTGAELLFAVAGQAHERQSLVVTTNLPFEDSPDVLGSERLTSADQDQGTPREATRGGLAVYSFLLNRGGRGCRRLMARLVRLQTRSRNSAPPRSAAAGSARVRAIG